LRHTTDSKMQMKCGADPKEDAFKGVLEERRASRSVLVPSSEKWRGIVKTKRRNAGKKRFESGGSRGEGRDED